MSETRHRIEMWWARMANKPGIPAHLLIAKEEWDELDSAIRADERAQFSKPSCATCKWAEVHEREEDGTLAWGEPDEATALLYPLICNRADGGSGHTTLGERITNPAPMGAWCEGAFRADLYVKPTFGCVQWEGK